MLTCRCNTIQKFVLHSEESFRSLILVITSHHTKKYSGKMCQSLSCQTTFGYQHQNKLLLQWNSDLLKITCLFFFFGSGRAGTILALSFATSFTAPGFCLLTDHLRWEFIFKRQFFRLFWAKDKLRKILAIRTFSIDMRPRITVQVDVYPQFNWIIIFSEGISYLPWCKYDIARGMRAPQLELY